MTRKQQPETRKVKKLAVKRTTVKDLDFQSKRGNAVRGGGSSSGGGFGSTDMLSTNFAGTIVA